MPTIFLHLGKFQPAKVGKFQPVLTDRESAGSPWYPYQKSHCWWKPRTPTHGDCCRASFLTSTNTSRGPFIWRSTVVESGCHPGSTGGGETESSRVSKAPQSRRRCGNSRRQPSI